MVHDYWLYRPDASPVKAALPGTRTVLTWFSQYEQPDGLLRKLPWWSFIDWFPPVSCRPTMSTGNPAPPRSNIWGLDGRGRAGAGDGRQGPRHTRGPAGAACARGLYEKCWDAGRKLLADNPDHTAFSQQTNTLGVLFDVIPRGEQQGVLRQLMDIAPGRRRRNSERLVLLSLLSSACAGTRGDGGRISRHPEAMARSTATPFSTWPETPGKTRSDSHAWSAHPIYDLLTAGGRDRAGIAGVRHGTDCSAPGGSTRGVGGVSSSAGMIKVHSSAAAWGDGSVTLPRGCGRLPLAGEEQPLQGGVNRIGGRD